MSGYNFRLGIAGCRRRQLGEIAGVKLKATAIFLFQRGGVPGEGGWPE